MLPFQLPNIDSMKIYHILLGIILVFFQACTRNDNHKMVDLLEEETYTVLINEAEVGHLKVTRSGDTLLIDYDYKENGRGPSIKEVILLNSNGLPTKWDITGNTTFGNSIYEHFKMENGLASWTDASGSQEVSLDHPLLYINQFGSPYSSFIQASFLLHSRDQNISSLPSGELHLTKLDSFKINVDSTELGLNTYVISGKELNPAYFILDHNNHFFAYMDFKLVVLRSGFEGEEKRMRQLFNKYATERFERLQSLYAHRYKGNFRVKNIRIFNPKKLSLSEPSSILISDEKIVSIDGPEEENGFEVLIIEGDGGVLVPGLYDMHTHMRDNDALLNILAGVTSVRDMGNNNEVLESLNQKIESGKLAGPRISRLGLIEGKSKYSSTKGILVASQDEALQAVDFYAGKGFDGVKLYNSMNGDWAPAIVKRAHELGLYVCGHIPAFSTANEMISAGFDELTHINLVMLGWILEPDEDTRTLLRLTAQKRFPDLDLNSPEIRKTLDLMVANNVAIEPTMAINEFMLLSRNGETQIGRKDYIENMPPNTQRNAKVALAKIEDGEEDQAYRLAFDKQMETLKLMKEHGIPIIPGTDMSRVFNMMHRELELFQQLGYSSAEVLKLASYDMAQRLGHEERGTIEPGMLADFFLVPGNPIKDLKAIRTISMVSRGGIIYYPSEIYPEYGIKPFIEKPKLEDVSK